MSTEYGLKMATALRAVARMHSDTSKLLVDCDRQIGKGRKSLFGNFATRDLTYHVDASYWMPEGVFRYYEAGDLLADGVCAEFLMEDDGPATEEPVLIVARIQYAAGESALENGLKQRCNGWDLYYCFFKYAPAREFGKVLACGNADSGRIEWARVMAVPLYSIHSVDDVAAMMRKVTAMAQPAGGRNT